MKLLSIITPILLTFSASNIYAAQEITWTQNLNNAINNAKTSNKNIFIYFYSPTNCIKCTQVEQLTFPNRNVIGFLQATINVKVDVTRLPQIAQAYEIQSVPAYAYTDPTGRVLILQEGLKTPGELMYDLVDIEDMYITYTQLLADSRINPQDVKIIHKIAKIEIQVFAWYTDGIEKLKLIRDNPALPLENKIECYIWIMSYYIYTNNPDIVSDYLNEISQKFTETQLIPYMNALDFIKSQMEGLRNSQ